MSLYDLSKRLAPLLVLLTAACSGGLVKIGLGPKYAGAVPIYLKDNPSLRFIRDVWVPPHSQRTTWLPIEELRRGTARIHRLTLYGLSPCRRGPASAPRTTRGDAAAACGARALRTSRAV